MNWISHEIERQCRAAFAHHGLAIDESKPLRYFNEADSVAVAFPIVRVGWVMCAVSQDEVAQQPTEQAMLALFEAKAEVCAISVEEAAGA